MEINDTDGFFVATVKVAKPLPEVTPQIEQLVQRVTSLFEQYVKLQQSLNVETVASAIRTDEPSKLADTIAANLQLEVPDKQELLDIFDLPERLLKIGRECAPLWKEPYRSADHGELLYDDKGLPK